MICSNLGFSDGHDDYDKVYVGYWQRSDLLPIVTVYISAGVTIHL